MLNNISLGFPGGLDGKESTRNVGDLGSITGLGRSPGGGHGKPLQYSCLENPMNTGAWQAAVHRIAKRWTQLQRVEHTARMPHYEISLL